MKASSENPNKRANRKANNPKLHASISYNFLTMHCILSLVSFSLINENSFVHECLTSRFFFYFVPRQNITFLKLCGLSWKARRKNPVCSETIFLSASYSSRVDIIRSPLVSKNRLKFKVSHFALKKAFHV